MHRLRKVQPKYRLALKAVIEPLCLGTAIDHVQRGLTRRVVPKRIGRLAHRDLLAIGIKQQYF